MPGWVDSKKYNETWKVVEKIPSGAQGDSFFATNVDDVAFLKSLKSNKDPERRARFFEEAAAYFRLDHPRLPKFIESNSQHFKEFGYKLYLVCDKIDGESLENIVKANGPFGYEESLLVAFGLIEVLEYLHDRSYIHRDVKPGNIVLKGGKPEGVVLVDLGLGHDAAQAEKAHETNLGQELGNRFLRLPELSVGSERKRDSRTDLAFAAGILLFCLTGLTPANLLDETGKMPHQRDPVMEQLRHQVPKHALFPLLNLFDKAFSQALIARYQDAAELKGALEKVRDATPQSSDPSSDELMQLLKDKISSVRNEKFKKTRSSLDSSYGEVTRVYNEVAESVNPVLSTIQTGQNSANNSFTTSIGFVQAGDNSKSAFVKVDIYATGDQIVLQMDDEIIYRTSLDQPTFGPDFDEAAKKKFALTAISAEEK